MSRLQDVIFAGIRADQPLGTDVSPGTLYAVTDEGYLIEQSDGTTWSQYGPAGSSSSLPSTVQGDLLYASATDTISALAKNATATRYLSNTGTTNNPAWAQVALTTGVSGILPVANGGTGSASGSAELKATVTITDAEFKALPTAPKELVAAPGAGFYIAWSRIYIKTFFTSGAYTGASAAFSALMAVSSTGANQSLLIGNDNSVTPNVTALNRLVAAASRRAYLFPYAVAIGDTGNEEYILPCGADGTIGIADLSDMDNKSLTLLISNGAVNLGGGNAANTCKVTTFYTIEATT